MLTDCHSQSVISINKSRGSLISIIDKMRKNCILFAQLQIYRRFDKNVAALDLDDTRHIHVLELLPVLLFQRFEMLAYDFLMKRSLLKHQMSENKIPLWRS